MRTLYSTKNNKTKKIFYIYKIINKINGKMYIGQRHTNKESLKDKYFGSGKLLEKSIKKYGKHNFIKEILKDGIKYKNNANIFEKKFIKKLNSKVPIGYNLTDGGEGLYNPSTLTRKKISDGNKGIIPWNKGKINVYSKETRMEMSNIKNGKKVSKKTRMKISNYNKGKKISEETKRKISIGNKGRKLSEETKRKISIGNKGRKLSEEQKQNVSRGKMGSIPWNKNKKWSEEIKIKMRKPHKKHSK